MKALVLGAYGMLGHKLLMRLQEDMDVLGTCRELRKERPWSSILDPSKLVPGVDAEHMASIEKVLDEASPDAVANCIGIIKQVKEAKDPYKSIHVNAMFPHMLHRACEKRGIRLVHFSTDCVFSGKKGRYRLGDPSDAEDLYGKTKFMGELHGTNALTIRSSIIGRELGTANGLLEWFLSQRGKTVKGYTKAIFTGLTTLEMSKVVSKVLRDHQGLEGVYQVASEHISKHDLLVMINEMAGLDIDIEPDDSTVCDRSLDGSEFRASTGYVAPSWRDMVKELVADFETYDPDSRR